jgi:hypothetical protein
MKTTTLTVAAAAIVMFAQSASTREYHHRHHHHHHVAASRGTFGQTGSAGPALPNELFSFAAANASVDQTVSAYRGRNQARPAAWCGWEMRRLVGADPGPRARLRYGGADYTAA